MYNRSRTVAKDKRCSKQSPCPPPTRHCPVPSYQHNDGNRFIVGIPAVNGNTFDPDWMQGIINNLLNDETFLTNLATNTTFLDTLIPELTTNNTFIDELIAQINNRGGLDSGGLVPANTVFVSPQWRVTNPTTPTLDAPFVNTLEDAVDFITANRASVLDKWAVVMYPGVYGDVAFALATTASNVEVIDKMSSLDKVGRVRLDRANTTIMAFCSQLMKGLKGTCAVTGADLIATSKNERVERLHESLSNAKLRSSSLRPKLNNSSIHVIENGDDDDGGSDGGDDGGVGHHSTNASSTETLRTHTEEQVVRTQNFIRGALDSLAAFTRKTLNLTTDSYHPSILANQNASNVLKREDLFKVSDENGDDGTAIDNEPTIAKTETMMLPLLSPVPVTSIVVPPNVYISAAVPHSVVLRYHLTFMLDDNAVPIVGPGNYEMTSIIEGVIFDDCELVFDSTGLGQHPAAIGALSMYVRSCETLARVNGDGSISSSSFISNGLAPAGAPPARRQVLIRWSDSAVCHFTNFQCTNIPVSLYFSDIFLMVIGGENSHLYADPLRFENVVTGTIGSGTQPILFGDTDSGSPARIDNHNNASLTYFLRPALNNMLVDILDVGTKVHYLFVFNPALPPNAPIDVTHNARDSTISLEILIPTRNVHHNLHHTSITVYSLLNAKIYRGEIHHSYVERTAGPVVRAAWIDLQLFSSFYKTLVLSDSSASTESGDSKISLVDSVLETLLVEETGAADTRKVLIDINDGSYVNYLRIERVLVQVLVRNSGIGELVATAANDLKYEHRNGTLQSLTVDQTVGLSLGVYGVVIGGSANVSDVSNCDLTMDTCTFVDDATLRLQIRDANVRINQLIMDNHSTSIIPAAVIRVRSSTIDPTLINITSSSFHGLTIDTGVGSQNAATPISVNITDCTIALGVISSSACFVVEGLNPEVILTTHLRGNTFLNSTLFDVRHRMTYDIVDCTFEEEFRDLSANTAQQISQSKFKTIVLWPPTGNNLLTPAEQNAVTQWTDVVCTGRLTSARYSGHAFRSCHFGQITLAYPITNFIATAELQHPRLTLNNCVVGTFTHEVNHVVDATNTTFTEALNFILGANFNGGPALVPGKNYGSLNLRNCVVEKLDADAAKHTASGFVIPTFPRLYISGCDIKTLRWFYPLAPTTPPANAIPPPPPSMPLSIPPPGQYPTAQPPGPGDRPYLSSTANGPSLIERSSVAWAAVYFDPTPAVVVWPLQNPGGERLIFNNCVVRCAQFYGHASRHLDIRTQQVIASDDYYHVLGPVGTITTSGTPPTLVGPYET